MAHMMKCEYNKVTALEKKKEEERWEQSLQYHEQLERQLEEQVRTACLRQ